jgi:uncharacterized repeat protein (TIGR04138 family)
MKKRLDDIAVEDGRFSTSVVKFVYEALSYTIRKKHVEPDHVSGQTLCDGIRELAQEKWGRLAKLVFNTGGVKTTHDFGEIVFLMIDHQWMSAQPTDTIEDFDDVYDFQTAFKDEFVF